MNKHFLFSSFELFLIFVLPIFLLLNGSIPLEHRKWLFLPVLLLISLSIWREKSNWSWKKLGLRSDNLKKSFLPYLIGTLFGVVVLIGLALLLRRSPAHGWYLEPHFQFFFLLSSAFQEFTYRGYLVPKLEKMFTSSALQVLVNALLFTFLHSFFPNPQLVLPLTFIAGLVFTVVYKKYPNLYLITLAHSVLNFITVLYCFVSLSQTC
jgi:membrane protease YdiL (CAAX protease family)